MIALPIGAVRYWRVLNPLKRVLLGTPLPSSQAPHERLTKVTGLAVLSSDALSSVAYATDAMLAVLVPAGLVAVGATRPLAFLIAALLVIVTFSYRQTIHAYPQGGGAYIVAKDNLGVVPGLIAATALLIDYVLTVSVSVAAGVAAVVSAAPAVSQYRFAAARQHRELDGALLNVHDAVGRIALGENDVGGLIGCDGFPDPCGTEKSVRVERRLLLDLHDPWRSPEVS
jgi:amino acid transporter